MFINKQWRILTIGDGDLSFSWSVYHRQQAHNITASTLDCKNTILSKYQTNSLTQLQEHGVDIIFELDICNPASFPSGLQYNFDVVIFQFPLIPAFNSKAEFDSKGKLHKNTLNRLLIYRFLQHSFEYFLDPNGKRLAYVTSKDVKPYAHWNIEQLTPMSNSVEFLGWMPFSQSDFPEYQLRNVDRDKVLKSTASKTYVWGRKEGNYSDLSLNMSLKQQSNYCELCGKGPFNHQQDRQIHELSAFHQRLAGFEQRWRSFLDQDEKLYQ